MSGPHGGLPDTPARADSAEPVDSSHRDGRRISVSIRLPVVFRRMGPRSCRLYLAEESGRVLWNVEPERVAPIRGRNRGVGRAVDGMVAVLAEHATEQWCAEHLEWLEEYLQNAALYCRSVADFPTGRIAITSSTFTTNHGPAFIATLRPDYPPRRD